MDCVKFPKGVKSQHCPYRMSDQRAFTDFRSNQYINCSARYENGLCTGADYRAWLTHNAVKLMNDNSEAAWAKNGCKPCKNLCLGIDESKRPGNSSNFDANTCIPPPEFYKYVGFDGTHYPMLKTGFNRPSVPSGNIMKNMS